MKIKHPQMLNSATILQIILSFLGTYGLCYLSSLMGISYASFSILNIMLMAALFFLLSFTGKNLKELKISNPGQYRRRLLYAFILSFLFSISMIMGYQLQINGMTECGLKGKGLILLRGFCLAIAVFPFGNIFFQGMDQIAKTRSRAAASGQGNIWKSGKLYAVFFAIIFICLVPVWLAYYPIIMSYDFHRQINEAVNGFIWFVEYQPLAHTWIIWLFLQLGRLLNSMEAGMAGMALFHMMIYSLVTAYACVLLYRILQKKWCAVIAVLFFSIFPLNSVMVVCTTKDVLFSAFFLLFFLLLAERTFFLHSKRQKLILDLLLVLEGCIMIQFRSNAIYAVVAFSILWLLFANKKEKFRILILCTLLIAGSQGTASAIKAALGTELGVSRVEMYSVPIQQFIRVGFYHGHELDPETRMLLNSYIPEEAWSNYNPAISDGGKAAIPSNTFSSAWEGHTPQLFKDWLKIGLQFPNEYIDAFLELTRGYWFLDDRSYAEYLGYGTEERYGVIFTYNSSSTASFTEIQHESKFPWLEKQLEQIVSGNTFYNWPVISVLFKSSLYVWGFLLLFVTCFYLRLKRQALLYLFPLMYMGTVLLGPVAQIRYVFPIMMILPTLIALLFTKEKSQE